MWRKILQGAVLAIIAAWGIKTSVESLQDSFVERSNDSEVIAAWGDILNRLTEPIPFKRGFVGYLSSADMPGADFNSNDAEGEFVLTQYAVAPLILVRGTEQEWNILNLDPETLKKWREENKDRFEVIRSGGGMTLVRRIIK